MDRIILHADMNNCYASIEVKMHPEWEGLPLAVCGSREDRQGIVLAKSQEAKAMGVKTGEAIWEAQEKCPELLIVPPHYEAYLDYSNKARKIYYDYTNQVESFGLDECWLDVTGSTHLFGTGETIAHTLRERMKAEMGITISVGVSFNKVFAKLGSDLKKPDAVTSIPRRAYRDIVWELPVKDLLGIGRATEMKLHKVGIYSLGQLAKTNPDHLHNMLGINGYYLWLCVNGLDESPVQDRDFRPPIKTIGRGTTCREDLINNHEVWQVFQELAFEVSARLRRHGFRAGGVQITVKDNQLFSRQYQMPLRRSTQSSILLTEAATALFRERYPWDREVRALTIRAIQLSSDQGWHQADFFEDYKSYIKKEQIDQTLYEIKSRFGETKVGFAGLMHMPKLPGQRNDIVTLPGGILERLA